ncbi:MAG: rod shape-determining protein RodA [Saprospiraceae bacterium]
MAQKASISKDKTYDWITLSVFFSLVTIGWFMVYAVLHDPAHPYAFLDFGTLLGAQTVWVVLSIFTFIAVLVIDWKFWNALTFPIYGITMLLLIMVLIIGKEINGARAWFAIGPFSMQPSEWAKFGTALAVSSYLSFFKSSTMNSKVVLVSMALFISPALLILLQPDFGSALVYFSFFILLYRRGQSPWVIISGIGLAAVFILSLLFGPLHVTSFLLLLGFAVYVLDLEKPKNAVISISAVLLIMVFMLFQDEKTNVIIPPSLAFLVYLYRELKKKNIKIVSLITSLIIVASSFGFMATYVFDNVLKPHQQERINVWLAPEKCDPRGSLYNILQAKMAIGSGGLTGKGFLQGEMTKLDYVPEQETDFIFTSIGEEQGFVGILGVIFLFTVLLTRCIIIAERANLEFIRNYGYAVAGILFFHFLFNIGMTMGLLPVVGIPLPFISKGGSSLIAFSIMVAVLVKLDMARYRAN